MSEPIWYVRVRCPECDKTFETPFYAQKNDKCSTCGTKLIDLGERPHKKELGDVTN